MRTLLRRTVAVALGATAIALPAAAHSQATSTPDTRPTVAVIDFTNSAIGKANADMEPLRAGIAGMLITELANNDRIRVVEREQLKAVFSELQLGQSPQVDAQTAVRIGKLLNAHHIVTGGFVTDGKGRMRLTSRSIETETGRIEYTTAVSGKSDDVLDMIDKLAGQLNAGLKLPAIAVREVRTGSAAGTSGTAATTTAKPTEVAQAPRAKQPVPFQAVMLYSRALQALDKQDRQQAVQLFRQSLDKFPDYEAARQQLARLEAAPKPGA